jgi:hypothetical protein
MLVLAGCGSTHLGPAAQPSAAESPTSSAEPPPSSDESSPEPTPEPIHQVALPTAIQIDHIGVLSSLIPLGVDHGAFQIPPVSHPEQAGYYCPAVADARCGAPLPGEVGPAAILGHVDGDGKRGVFYRLKELRGGDRIVIERADRSKITYRVTVVEQYPKDNFPFGRVFGNTDQTELRIITCGGTFDHAAHSYDDSIVAFAEPA